MILTMMVTKNIADIKTFSLHDNQLIYLIIIYKCPTDINLYFKLVVNEFLINILIDKFVALIIYLSKCSFIIGNQSTEFSHHIGFSGTSTGSRTNASQVRRNK